MAALLGVCLLTAVGLPVLLLQNNLEIRAEQERTREALDRESKAKTAAEQALQDRRRPRPP